MNLPVFRTYILFLIFFLIITIQNVLSQNENSAVLVTKKLYTNIDGLPSREITCAVQDNYGYMWFGTRNGLCRFDGDKFLIFNTTNSNLFYNNIKSIFFDKNEGIIINFNSSNGYYPGLIHELHVINTKSLEIKKFDDYYKNCPFKAKQILNIVISNNTADLIFRLNDYDYLSLNLENKFTAYQLSSKELFRKLDTKIAKGIVCMNTTNSNLLFVEPIPPKVNLKKYVFVISDQNTFFQNPESEPFQLYTDELGTVITSVDKHGATFNHYISYKGSITSFKDDQSLMGRLFKRNFSYLKVNGSDVTLEVDNRNVWRLVHLGRNDIIIVDSLDEEPIKRSKLISAFRDKLDNYWLCTTEGLIKLNIERKSFYKHLTLKQYPQILNHSVRGILKLNDEILVSTPEGVVISKGNNNKIIRNERNFAITKHFGDVLISGCNTIIRRNVIEDKPEFHHFIQLGEVWSLFSVDSNNVIAFGIETIAKYNLKTKVATPIPNMCKIRPNACYRVIQLGNNRHLLVGESGLFILNKKYEIENYYSNDSTNKRYYMPIHHINDVHIDVRDTNIYWLATAYDGLFKWNRSLNIFTKYGMSNGFLSEVCYRIEEDAYNHLWISTDFGIARFNKALQEAVVFTEKDGISHNEFNRASSYVDSDGIMYFGGINGYTTFHPKNFIRRKKESVPLVITKMNSFNIQTNKEQNELNNFWQNHKLTLTKNQKNLTLHIALLDYETRKHEYAYQLQGYNHQWQYTSEGKISVNGLPYGNYILLVIAQNSHGIWLAENMIKIPIQVIRPYYETWWFYTLIGLTVVFLIALIFVLIYKAKVRSLKRLADLRLTIASDLHDQVGGLLNKAAIQSELLQSKQKDENSSLSKIALNNRTALSSMRDIIWNLDPRNDNSVSLADKMNDYVQNMFADDFNYTINIKAIEDVQLNHEIRQNLNMIFKEAINNIVKHAKGSEVKINLEIVNNTIVMTVFNSGEYDLSKKSFGQGLRNMEMRAQKVKGSFSYNFNNGFEIIVSVPVSH